MWYAVVLCSVINCQHFIRVENALLYFKLCTCQWYRGQSRCIFTDYIPDGKNRILQNSCGIREIKITRNINSCWVWQIFLQLQRSQIHLVKKKCAWSWQKVTVRCNHWHRPSYRERLCAWHPASFLQALDYLENYVISRCHAQL